MEYNKEKKKHKVYLFILIFIILTIIFYRQVNFVKNDIDKAFLSIKGSVFRTTMNIKNNINDVIYIKKIIEENKRLNEENYKLKIEKLKITDLEAENERLREILGMRQEKKLEFMVGSILLRDGMTLYENLYINIGAMDGVKKGMVVLNREALLGKIVEVHPKSSKVELITKKGFYISVLTENRQYLGIARGDNASKLRLEFITADNEVKEGETVRTSGVSKIYPKGIMVGKVSKIEKTNNNLYNNITVELPYNILYLDEVLVLKKEAAE